MAILVISMDDHNVYQAAPSDQSEFTSISNVGEYELFDL